VIGMVKNNNKRYLVGNERLSLKALYETAPRVEGKNRHVLRCIQTSFVPGIAVNCFVYSPSF
jgi:hypothetical protein